MRICWAWFGGNFLSFVRFIFSYLVCPELLPHSFLRGGNVQEGTDAFTWHLSAVSYSKRPTCIQAPQILYCMCRLSHTVNINIYQRFCLGYSRFRCCPDCYYAQLLELLSCPKPVLFPPQPPLHQLYLRQHHCLSDISGHAHGADHGKSTFLTLRRSERC